MDERSRRVGRNEALFRQINDEVDELNRGLAQLTDETIHVVCECGNLQCQERLVLELPVYERIRKDGAQFVILPGHQIPGTEDVVEEHEAYLVVRKHEDGPAQLARDLDPRS